MIKVVKCVKSGDGFKKGEYYPVVGWNNGVNIARVDENGDPYIGIYLDWPDSECDVKSDDPGVSAKFIYPLWNIRY